MAILEKLFPKWKKAKNQADIRIFPMEYGGQNWRYLTACDGGEKQAMRLSAVSACVEIRSDTIGKLPFYVENIKTKVIDEKNPITRLLRVRPNELMTPFTFKKLLETWRLLRGNAYVYLPRNKRDGEITDLIPLDPDFVSPEFDESGRVWYRFENGHIRRLLDSDSIVHLKGFTENGLIGQSVLQRAAKKVRSMAEQEEYQNNYYTNQARPSGVLSVDSDLSAEAKQKIREEWQKIYGGVDNAFKMAVLDYGMQFKPISVTHRDSQFIETTEASIADIARYFLVPLYKLQSGKQTYDSNEQNSIEYVKTTISPTVKQYEEEFTYKCLFQKDIMNGNEIVVNMNAEMRGDQLTRANWYNTMRNIGAYSVDDIRNFEDLPGVGGGDVRIMPLNSIPLERVNEYFSHLMQNADAKEEGKEEKNREHDE